MSYREASTLHELYVEEDLDQAEIADRFDVNQTTIGRWVRRHNIKKPLDDPNLLREMYWDKGMSLREMADEIDCWPGSVAKAMERHGIDRRESTHEKPPNFCHADAGGYEAWKHMVDGTYHSVKVHRLLCVAEHGFDALDGMDVHHINEIPWDNRPENLELLTKEEHSREHIEERNPDGTFK